MTRADLEAHCNDKNTSLHLAAWKGKLAAAEKLLEHGAIVHMRNKVGWTPLHHASFYGHLDVMQLLLEHRADADAQNDGRARRLPCI